MTRLMFDSVNYRAIPAGSELVAGYVDGRRSKWPAEAWDAFPGRILVRIAVLATTNDGHVLDVETGNATPDEVPGWLAMRRAAGVDPTVYGNAETIRDVEAICIAAGVTLPHFWVANYNDDPTIPDGCVAKQYREDKTQNIDYSSVADYWPGVDAVSEYDQGGDVEYRELDQAESIAAINEAAASLGGALNDNGQTVVEITAGVPQALTDRAPGKRWLLFSAD
jgi:hypothetical protein